MRYVFLGLFLISAVTVSGQAAKSSKVPRTPDGHADLQGTWDFAQLTPFERPGNFAGKESLTDDEAEEFAQQRIETGNKDKRDGGAAADVERAYNDFWWDFGKRVAKQTSLVVDPPDGRVPATTPEAPSRGAASTTTPRSARSPSAVSSASTRGRRWCRARTTITCRLCRPATA